MGRASQQGGLWPRSRGLSARTVARRAGPSSGHGPVLYVFRSWLAHLHREAYQHVGDLEVDSSAGAKVRLQSSLEGGQRLEPLVCEDEGSQRQREK